MKPIFLITFISLVVFACNSRQSQANQSTGNHSIDTLKKKIVQREVLSSVNYNQVFENKTVDGTLIKLLEIGNLNVPTGKIVACDPLVTVNYTPFNKTVKPGIYPVKIYIAETKESGERYAIAKLEFSSKKADKWVLALQDGEDTAELKNPDDYFGFPVDAGLGGFFDYKAGLEYGKFTDQFQKEHPNGNIYEDYLASEFKKNAKKPNEEGDWINLKIPNSDLNITMFHSGYGDGSYPAYWGMTKNNEIVSLIIDFFVLPLNKK
ncbi:DUF4241 domain-containing protein [Mucilaginibacter gynuensis]|uniref:DUF4241 domain-containing protein n=1 Tax=Mucilaginibacter gynuensis TaxID=1302236 RepID=A0ABP8FT99_9SPHI